MRTKEEGSENLQKVKTGFMYGPFEDSYTNDVTPWAISPKILIFVLFSQCFRKFLSFFSHFGEGGQKF